MTKATRPVTPTARGRNVTPTRLTEHEAAAALVALLNGAEQIPAVAMLRSIVKRAARARIISTKGRRRHG
jgi:hypothetical protein